jgi:hypothetical protein
VGDTSRTWDGERRQAGYVNTLSAVEWVKRNIHVKLSNLVIMGQSAGAVASQAWSGPLLKQFEHTTASVFVDSFTGLAPRRSLQRVLRGAGTCSKPEWKSLVHWWCHSGLGDSWDWLFPEHSPQGPLQTVFVDTIKRNPQVQFGIIHIKRDIVQKAFYNLLLLTLTPISGGGLLTGDPYLAAQKKLMLPYIRKDGSGADRFPNIKAFIMDDLWHVVTTGNPFYTRSVKLRNGKQTFVEWFARIVTRSGNIHSTCAGYSATELMNLGSQAMYDCM